MIEELILNKAIEHWGVEMQTVKACEELAELIRALSRVLLAAHTNAPAIEFNTAVDNVREEIADVEIMLEQLRIIFEYRAIEGIRIRKLRRLAGILGLHEIKPPASDPTDPAVDPDEWSAQLGGED